MPRGVLDKRMKPFSRPPSAVDGKTEQAASTAFAAHRHSDNGRLSTPWREVIFLSAVMDTLFDPSLPALVYGP
jgi:hypothetical protein